MKIKKTFNSISLLILTAIFSAGGFYLGSRGQKMEIVLPASAQVATVVEVIKATTTAPAKVLPKQNLGGQATPTAKPKTPVTTPVEATPQAPTPEPTTAVS